MDLRVIEESDGLTHVALEGELDPTNAGRTDEG
jgi:hypothetical protein